MNQCVILAGGLATRMRPLTETIPKALIPIENTPFIHYQLQWLSQCGISDVVLCIGYKGEMIQEYVDSGYQWGLRVHYAFERGELLGTAGALRNALDLGFLEPRFLVTYGDSFLPVNFGEVLLSFQSRSEPALLTILRNDEKWDSSNVCIEGKKVKLYDKWIKTKPPEMKYIDYGLSAFTRELIQQRIPPKQKMDLAVLLRDLSIEGKLAAFEVGKRFYEIGSPSGLEEFRQYVSR